MEWGNRGGRGSEAANWNYEQGLKEMCACLTLSLMP